MTLDEARAHYRTAEARYTEAQAASAAARRAHWSGTGTRAAMIAANTAAKIAAAELDHTRDELVAAALAHTGA